MPYEEYIGGLSWDTFWKATKSFRFFIREVFPLSIKNYIPAPHLEQWADIMQNNHRTALLAPRGHLKSTLMYAYLMWRLLNSFDHKENWLYISFKLDMAQYHIKNLKRMIEDNPIFTSLYDFTDAESTAQYGWSRDKPSFEIIPAGITSFKRGWHGTGIIADDILADPAQELNPTTIHRITKVFFEDVIYLPNPDGYIHLAGTPQHHEDLFFQIKNRPELEFSWHKFTAILDDVNKKVLWEQRWTYEMLDKQRKANPKGFLKEMMVEPVLSADSYLEKDKLYNCVNPDLKPLKITPRIQEFLKTKFVVGGWDLGKKSHPSHIAVFYENNGKLIQIYDKWLDHTDYITQIAEVNALIEHYMIDSFYYDDTRGELEMYKEKGELNPVLQGVVFTNKVKANMAAVLEEYINLQKIELMNNPRTINELLKVNSTLEAVETTEGHGDSFWSIAMAVSAHKKLRTGASVQIVGGGW